MKMYVAALELEFRSKRLLLCFNLGGWNLHIVGELDEKDNGSNLWAILNPMMGVIERHREVIGSFADLKFLGCAGIYWSEATSRWGNGLLVEYKPHRYCLETDKENAMKPELQVDSLEMAKLEIMKQLQGMDQNVQIVPLPKSKEIH